MARLHPAPAIAITGAWISGLTAAAPLRDRAAADIYEQAGAFVPVGAGIQLDCSSIRRGHCGARGARHSGGGRVKVEGHGAA